MGVRSFGIRERTILRSLFGGVGLEALLDWSCAPWNGTRALGIVRMGM